MRPVEIPAFDYLVISLASNITGLENLIILPIPFSLESCDNIGMAQQKSWFEQLKEWTTEDIILTRFGLAFCVITCLFWWAERLSR